MPYSVWMFEHECDFTGVDKLTGIQTDLDCGNLRVLCYVMDGVDWRLCPNGVNSENDKTYIVEEIVYCPGCGEKLETDEEKLLKGCLKEAKEENASNSR